MSTEKKPAKHEPDWAAIDALTDADIDRQIAANPDAAPDMGDVPLEHWTVYQPLDVKAIRKKSGMTQEQFAKTYELSLGALRDWEQQRRIPHGPARVLLKVIDREPEAVSRALAAAAAPGLHPRTATWGGVFSAWQSNTGAGWQGSTMASGHLLSKQPNTLSIMSISYTMISPQLPPERNDAAHTPRRKRS